MGQYWKPVNLTKREFINPHKLASGLKLWEQLANDGVGRALVILLAAQSETRGGGDLRANDPNGMIGRWAGDRVAIVGDYAEDSDLPSRFRASKIYGKCRSLVDAQKYGESTNGLFKDITDDVCAIIEQELDGKFSGEGWREFKQNED